MTLGQAVEEYQKRQSREHHPGGKFDKGGRWYPSAEEKRACCDKVRSPSRAFPYSLMLHCRTAGHVAALFGVNTAELRAAGAYVVYEPKGELSWARARKLAFARVTPLEVVECQQ